MAPMRTKDLFAQLSLRILDMQLVEQGQLGKGGYRIWLRKGRKAMVASNGAFDALTHLRPKTRPLDRCGQALRGLEAADSGGAASWSCLTRRRSACQSSCNREVRPLRR